MKDKQNTERIREYFQKEDKLGRHLGIEIPEVGVGWAKTKMKIQPYHLNGVGVVHGGAIFTLADVAFAAACNSHGTIAVAINVNISFVKAGVGEWLFAEAKEISRNHKLANCSIKITDDNGDLVAIFEGLAYRKKDKLLERK